MTIKHPLEIRPFFEANRDKLSDAKWLAAELKPQCRYKYSDGGLLHAQQNPEELAQWLILAASIQPRSYIEIGVFKCGTFFVTDSYLRVACCSYEYGKAVDRRAIPESFGSYSDNRNVRYAQEDSGMLQDGSEFDVAMVDANHSSRAARRDFKKVNRCRLIGIHDITFAPVRVGSVWNEIKAANPTCKTWEFTSEDRTPKAHFGIGAILLR